MRLLSTVVVHGLLFSGVYTALVAAGASVYTARSLNIAVEPAVLMFTFGGTLLSYNLHWWLSPVAFFSARGRAWSLRHRRMRPYLMVAGLLLAGCGLSQLTLYTLCTGLVAAALTLLYSAPKFPAQVPLFLNTVAAAKTFYLAAVWVVVTVVLPVTEESKFSLQAILFTGHRFFFIYALCLLFDLRDRDVDGAAGIATLATKFPASRQWQIFLLLLAASSLMVVVMNNDMENLAFWSMLMSIAVLLLLYRSARSTTSDVFYYLVLDGLMAAPLLMYFLKAAFL